MERDPVPQLRNLQARKQEVVRQQIWNSAIELFCASGFDEVTVEQIAHCSGVSRRTFFRYYSSKEDVLASALRNYAEALIAAITNSCSTASGIAIGKQSIVTVLQPFLISTERVMYVAKRSLSVRNVYLNQGPMVQDKLAEAFAVRSRRSGVPNLEDRALAALTLFGTNLCVELWIEQPERPLSEIVDEVFATFAFVTKSA